MSSSSQLIKQLRTFDIKGQSDEGHQSTADATSNEGATVALHSAKSTQKRQNDHYSWDLYRANFERISYLLSMVLTSTKPEMKVLT